MKTWKPQNFDLRRGRKLLAAIALSALPVTGAFAQDDQPAVVRPLTEAAEAARNAITEEDDRDDLIRAAQDRLKKMKGESTAATTITDRTNSGEPLRARPTGTPEPSTTAPTPPAESAPETPAPAPAPKPNPPTPSPAAADTPPAPAPVPLSANAGNVPPPAPLRPRYDKTPNTAEGGEVMEITAHESVMDEKNNKATFEGDVVVNHPTFVMKSEYLEVFMNDKDNPQLGPDGKEPPFKNAIATGPMVVIEQNVVEGGKQVVQIAKARKAVFDGITGDTILTGGPPFLQKGKQVIRPQSENAKIVLKSDGKHEVKGRSTFQIKVKGKAGASGPSLGGSLDSITNTRD